VYSILIVVCDIIDKLCVANGDKLIMNKIAVITGTDIKGCTHHIKEAFLVPLRNTHTITGEKLFYEREGIKTVSHNMRCRL